MILVYTEKNTPRLNYILKHIFTKMLLVDVRTTNDPEEFIAFIGPKINYSKGQLNGEFFIRAHDLLFEQGISDVEVVVQEWDDVPCFFSTSERSHVPFDVFAASFYLLSRYEEYLPHVKDQHGRYPAEESLAYKHKFLELPVVDIWVDKLKLFLEAHYPSFQFKERIYQAFPIVDVPVLYNYRKKGIIRTIASTLLDLAYFNLKDVFERFQVLLGVKKDPFDNFDALIQLHKKNNIHAIYFFLMGDYSTYDKNISINNPSFRRLVKSVADYSIVSLMASYEAFDNVEMLKMERKRLINFINRPVKRVRWRFNRLNIPESYRMMTNAEFNEDYTMGYSGYPGFRAGTCSPFNFYDISFEEQLPVKVLPFCASHVLMQNAANFQHVKRKLLALEDSVRSVNGTFTVVFSNEVLNPQTRNELWKLYAEMFSNKN
ncbi:hypothetical protein SAMN04487906_2226 [Zhouia amylolytica]|uniref:DUF7033 domain-containing protein n=2 Tax=Zhouia amylolytica TaxID=376730 RepID=A0A1I6TY06_9FLAO|nr:hypothetical protein SAMN04487906_2226 [Zhouia amylolytica]